ncbi:hypothetical protein MOV08_36780 [Streptomyces yunnanensis]|uniref:Uncharacterized protein n=1 Tax=Streptomyces yunnanensis TaxID=156453 RepID=A0ABY8AH06_9ACTN|nr:hypothetical protein [Streptomyces yunnanensis]WEB44305.1 hypothetical protein MOV08_36780 [Streptomyces yunnanensis]
MSVPFHGTGGDDARHTGRRGHVGYGRALLLRDAGTGEILVVIAGG